VETLIGVFDSQENARKALKDLLRENVPRESIVFLTRSENEIVALAEELRARVSGLVLTSSELENTSDSEDFLQVTPSIARFTVPGLGSVFSLGSGAKAALGLARESLSLGVGNSGPTNGPISEVTTDRQNAAVVQDILQSGRSLILVRTPWHEIATMASSILSRFGNDRSDHTRVKTHTVTRQVEGITVLDVTGKITAGEGSVILRNRVGELMQSGIKWILLNLQQVDYVDTSGIGELVRIHAALRKQGGQLKLVNIQKMLADILQMTCLHRVFDIQKDEASALKSFGRAAEASASSASASTAS
jgi:anti-sigma B factor antagonist